MLAQLDAGGTNLVLTQLNMPGSVDSHGGLTLNGGWVGGSSKEKKEGGRGLVYEMNKKKIKHLFFKKSPLPY